jgi:hypothetical protein
LPGAGTAVNTATQADAVGAFSADNTGAADATAQIQSAVDSLIDATGLAGGANGKPGGFTVLDGPAKKEEWTLTAIDVADQLAHCDFYISARSQRP